LSIGSFLVPNKKKYIKISIFGFVFDWDVVHQVSSELNNLKSFFYATR